MPCDWLEGLGLILRAEGRPAGFQAAAVRRETGSGRERAVRQQCLMVRRLDPWAEFITQDPAIWLIHAQTTLP